MNVISLLIGIRFPVLVRMMCRNGFSLRPAYVPRLMVLLFNSLLSSFFTLVENLKYSRYIRTVKIDTPPVFVIGHWRTGSTYLHQLISLDPRFTTPKTVQTVIPDHFLFSTKYYTPIMKRHTAKGRSMDDIQVLPTGPQEDEFALIRMGSESPMEKLFFPSGDRYFLLGYPDYIPKGKDLEKWKKNLLTFYRKITFLTGKPIVSKNPYHTLRIPLLAEMFPGAKFIHICRDPYDVVPSTVRMWNLLARSNRLKNTWKEPDTGEVASVLKFFLEYVSRERKKIEENKFAEIRFEDLENDPVKELKKIYAELNLSWSEEFEKKIREFTASRKDYKKNVYHLTRQEKDTIRAYFETSEPCAG
jgi:omega-hydroxy-beta-dihydromenaquinone-9 sulfotransferase